MGSLSWVLCRKLTMRYQSALIYREWAQWRPRHVQANYKITRVPVKYRYHQTYNISCILVGNKTVDRSNYIFILHKDNCKRGETFKFWNLLCVISEMWWLFRRDRSKIDLLQNTTKHQPEAFFLGCTVHNSVNMSQDIQIHRYYKTLNYFYKHTYIIQYLQQVNSHDVIFILMI